MTMTYKWIHPNPIVWVSFALVVNSPHSSGVPGCTLLQKGVAGRPPRTPAPALRVWTYVVRGDGWVIPMSLDEAQKWSGLSTQRMLILQWYAHWIKLNNEIKNMNPSWPMKDVWKRKRTTFMIFLIFPFSLPICGIEFTYEQEQIIDFCFLEFPEIVSLIFRKQYLKLILSRILENSRYLFSSDKRGYESSGRKR